MEITDFGLWHRLKSAHGIYFITRQKANFAGEKCGSHRFVRAVNLKPAGTGGLKTGWRGGWIFFEDSNPKLFFLDFLPFCARA